MSQKQGVDIDSVADSGMNINLISADSKTYQLSVYEKLF